MEKEKKMKRQRKINIHQQMKQWKQQRKHMNNKKQTKIKSGTEK